MGNNVFIVRRFFFFFFLESLPFVSQPQATGYMIQQWHANRYRIQQWQANRSLLNKTKRCNLRKEITINHIVGLINDKRRQWRVSVNNRQYIFVLSRRKLILF